LELPPLRLVRRDLAVDVRVRREDARLAARVAAAVEPTRIADDEGALRPRRRDSLGCRNRPLELLRRRVALALAPRPEVSVLSALRALRDVLEWPGVLVDVREVDEDLHDVLVR